MAVPIEPWLDKYGIVFREDKTGNQPIHCPNPHAHKNGDRTASASLHLDKGLFSCLACGAGGSAIDLIILMEGVSLREAFRIAESGSPEGSRQVPRQPQRTSLGLPGRSGNHRGDGKGSAPWAGFR